MEASGRDTSIVEDVVAGLKTEYPEQVAGLVSMSSKKVKVQEALEIDLINLAPVQERGN